MDVFVARQPIFDSKLATWGYELLFRSGVENAFIGKDGKAPDGDQATLSVMDSAFFSGISQITGNSKALVNFTRYLLLNGYAEILPKEYVIIEILETVEADEAVVEACYKLKNAGYTLALDDYCYANKTDGLLSVVDIVKVDFMQAGVMERMEIAEALLPMNITLLAEKVETQDEFEQAQGMGYTYFQGYFFSKPQIMSTARLPQSKMARLQLLREVNRPEINVENITALIKGDPGMTMRLLRYINSAFFGFRSKITSIKQAVVMLGRNNLRKWATVLALAENSEGKPTELLKQAIFRARFCELVAEVGRQVRNGDDYFIVGLLSLADALMDQPREVILPEMSLSDEMLGALFGNEQQTLLYSALQLVCGVENGHWLYVEELARSNNISQDVVAHAYREAVLTADKFILSNNAS